VIGFHRDARHSSPEGEGCAILVTRLSERDSHPENVIIQGVAVSGDCLPLQAEGKPFGMQVELIDWSKKK